MSQDTRARRFASLHKPGSPLILYNAWDAGSAAAVAAAGAAAIATGSWSVAAAAGYADGHQIPMEALLQSVRRIVETVDLPVSVDFEGGYAVEPEVLRGNISALIATGAIGLNFEDQVVGGEGLHSPDLQAARIGAIRAEADALGVPLFINARTDLFLKAPVTAHADFLTEARERALAYAAAGASGFFAPGLVEEDLIGALCADCPLPVNILTRPTTPSLRRMAELGVARISYGPAPYRDLMQQLTRAARAAFASA